MKTLALLCALGAGTERGRLPAAGPESPRHACEAVERDEEGLTDGPELDKAGVPLPNFGRVGEFLYRSGQPNREGLAELARQGFRTVLTLRDKGWEEEREAARPNGLKVLSVPMDGLQMPSFQRLDRALEILRDPAQGKLLVHCQRGKDRTGVVVAAHRTVVEGWSVERAAREAEGYGCCHPFFGELRSYLRVYLLYRRSRDAAPALP